VKYIGRFVALFYSTMGKMRKRKLLEWVLAETRNGLRNGRSKLIATKMMKKVPTMMIKLKKQKLNFKMLTLNDL